MRCIAHNQEATGICPYCGRALCASCERLPSSGRTACSATCAEALVQSERATQLILSKNVQGARVAAYFMYASGVAFIAIAIFGYFKEPGFFMGHLVAAVFGVVLSVSGVAAHRIAGSRAQRPNQALQPTPSRLVSSLSHD